MKNSISLTLKSQSVSKDLSNKKYILNTQYSGFTIEYFINNEWTTNIPEKVGTYDIRITRPEDEQFSKYENILPNGFQILPTYVKLNFVYVIAFAIFFLEVLSIIAVKWITKQKKNSPSYFSVIFPFAMFDLNEFIISCIAITLAIIGFVWLIKEIIVLQKTIPDPTQKNIYDNRSTI